MKRPVTNDDEKSLALRIRNRISARKSVEKKNKELEILKEENKYLRKTINLLQDRLGRLEKIIIDSHSPPSTLSVIQNVPPLVYLQELYIE